MGNARAGARVLLPFALRAEAGKREERGMSESAASSVFTILKILSYVALAAMVVAMAYAAVMAVRYWPGIGV